VRDIHKLDMLRITAVKDKDVIPVTIVKTIDPIEHKIAELEDILANAQLKDQRIAKQVKGDILKIKAGHTAEKNAAFMLDKLFIRSDRSVLLHDIRLEIDGDVAQIDHLSLNRFGFVSLFETKSFSTGVKVDDDGVFWHWDGYKKQYVEIPSPLLQSKRHEGTLRQALAKIDYPVAQVSHYVLIDYKAKLIKPKNGQFDNVCRPDRLEEVWDKEYKKMPSLGDVGIAIKSISRWVGGKVPDHNSLIQIGKRLAAQHRPLVTDLWARYGLVKPSISEAEIYLETQAEAQVIANEVPVIPAKVAENTDVPADSNQDFKTKDAIASTVLKVQPSEDERISSSKAAKQLRMTTQVFLEKVARAGLVRLEGEQYIVTEKGEKYGVENKVFRGIPYVSWPVVLVERIAVKLK